MTLVSLRRANAFAQGQFTEGVVTGRQNQNGFSSLDLRQTIDSFGKCVEKIRFAERREVHGNKALPDIGDIVGKIHFDLRGQIKRFQRHPVGGLKLGEEDVGPVGGVGEVGLIAQLAVFDQHNDGDGGLGGGEIRDHLRHAVFGDPEVFLFETGEIISAIVGDAHVKVDDRHGHLDGVAVGALLVVLRRRGSRLALGRGRNGILPRAGRRSAQARKQG